MWEQLGTTLSTADDLDGDGRPEVLAGAAGSPFVLEGNGRAAVLRGSDGTVLVEVRSRAVERCEDPVSPGRRCYPDWFGAARALSDAGGDGIVIVFGTPRALDPVKKPDRRGDIRDRRQRWPPSSARRSRLDLERPIQHSRHGARGLHTGGASP